MKGPARLLLIGIDGADHELLGRWIAEDRLPNLAELVGHGRLLRCLSTLPPLTAPAWTTALTGCNPGRHGTFDFLDFSFPERRPWWKLARGCPDLFEHLTTSGVTCAGVNIPMIYPARPAHGILIAGFGCPALTEEAFHPQSLREELFDDVPGYAAYPAAGAYLGEDPEALTRFPRLMGKAAEHILARHELDVLMVVFNSLDWAEHCHASTPDGFDGVPLEAAQSIDREIGRLLEATDWPSTPVLVVSDHGMKRATRQVNAPRLLTDLGLLAVRWAKGVPLHRRFGLSALVSAWGLAKRALPAGLTRRLRVAGEPIRTNFEQDAPSVVIDWTKTTVIPLGAYGSLRLAVQGREPEGRITRDEYPDVLQQVMDELRAAVLSRDDLFSGPLVDQGPDIVVTAQADDTALGVPALESHLLLFSRQKGWIAPLIPSWGVHAPGGILIMSGNDVAEAPCVDECSVADFTPTALHLLGLPVPPYMDGLALTDEDSVGSEHAPPNRRGYEGNAGARGSVDPTRLATAALVQRLEDLGYL
jgi:predicted AlkP superfamily phosphohydrolase/phosphomutase